MPTPTSEREKLLAVRLCGPRVIARLESIGITKLEDLAERDPYQLVHQVNIAAGRPIWRPPIAIHAMTNLISAACSGPRYRAPKDPPNSDGTSSGQDSLGCSLPAGPRH